MRSKHFENPARREWWSLHVEAWQRSGLSRRRYCRDQRLCVDTFGRWLIVITDTKTAKIRVETARETGRKEGRRTRFTLSDDKRCRAVQAFWAMHVEALNWSGMGVREYAASLRISRHSLARWRDLIAEEEVEIDWRAQLHPSARPKISTNVSTGANGAAVESGLTDATVGNRRGDARSNRRYFTDAEKLAIVMEAEAPGATVSQVARAHRIVTSMVFRWRVQFGFAHGEGTKLVAVRLADDQHDGPPGDDAAALLLRDLLPTPDGMAAVDLDDGRRVFAPVGIDPKVVRRYIKDREVAR